MKPGDLNLMSQLIESMNLAVEEMEKAVEKKDVKGFEKAKSEILRFQRQISELLK